MRNPPATRASYISTARNRCTLSGLDEKILRKLAADASNVLKPRTDLKHRTRKTPNANWRWPRKLESAIARAIPLIPGWQLAAFRN
jgi:hypothetical protein